MNETDIVERAQDGDADAFGKLVLRHQAMVYGIAMSRLANPDLAEEAAQESFLLAWRKLPELRRPERFGPWLRVIARRTAGRA
jgi:RNA polymerase sigma-70 factor (ECF subfamily)